MPKVELLPVTYDPDRLHMWADENFRRVVDAVDILDTEVDELQLDLAQQSSRNALKAVRITSNQSLVAGAFTAVIMNSEIYDEAGAYNPVTGAYTVPEDGLYIISCHFRLISAAAVQLAVASIFVDGIEVERGADMDVPNTHSIQAYWEYKLTVGKIVTVRVFVNGATPSIEMIAGGVFNWLNIRREGPL